MVMKRACGWALAASLMALTASGCDGCAGRGEVLASPDAGVAGRLSPEQAHQVLARVGERVITLGDYAAALERMDPFERMRYQTEDRRQALLDEMINVELLAREAERRGLDQRPETIELVRQFQRDELLARLRASLPRPQDLPAAEVSEYYQEHRAEFAQEELRRGAEIAVSDASLARRIIAEARGASPDRWRELVQKYVPGSVADSADQTEAGPALEVPGDLGFVSAAGGEPSASLPDEVRRVLFALGAPGDVHAQPIEYGGRQHVIRLVSVQPARQRSLAEADSMIRVRLVQRRQEQAQNDLVARLRQGTTIQVDGAALERIEPPNPAAAGPTAPRPSP
jgi:peptidyl-prolyl cis-trans isomerase C